jgi:broad specificity phosphatase PhoE
MVGLPARGKSFLSTKIVRFLSWRGTNTRIFNAGSTRRATLGTAKSGRAEFFAHESNKATRIPESVREDDGEPEEGGARPSFGDDSLPLSQRDKIAMSTLKAALQWLDTGGGEVAIFDATNTTKSRRSMIWATLMREHGSSCDGGKCGNDRAEYELIFIESICNDGAVLDANLRQKVHHSPDFAAMPAAAALADLRLRIEKYEEVYEPLADAEGFAYIKVIDLASKVECFRVFGKVPLLVTQLLMCCHTGARPVYLARAGHFEQAEGLEPLRRRAITTLIQQLDGTSDDIRAAADDQAAATAAAAAIAAAAAGAAAGPYADLDRKLSGDAGGDVAAAAAPAAAATSGVGGGGGLADRRAMNLTQCDVFMPGSATSAAALTQPGIEFSQRLLAFLEAQAHGAGAVVPITSTLPRASQTTAMLPADADEWSALAPLDTGICHGMKVEEVQKDLPQEYAAWERDPFRYRFPGGESLVDLNRRLSDLVLEVERLREPVLVVTHMAPVQSLVAYFLGTDMRKAQLLKVPRHSVIKMVPSNYGWQMTLIEEDELPFPVGKEGVTPDWM